MNKLSQVLLACFVLLSFSVTAQINLNDFEKHESKIYPITQLDRIKSNYIDNKGLFSHDVFFRKHGLFRLNEQKTLTPYFTVSFLKSDVEKAGDKFDPTKASAFVNIDFQIKEVNKYKALNQAEVIWDGRVYEDNYEIIVGGYSSRFNERPIGKINEECGFTVELSGEHVKEFPILDIPTEQILFDPFEWKLFKVEPSNGKTMEENSNHYLPLDIYGNKGELFQDLNFEIVQSGSEIYLFAFVDGKKTKVASCDLKDVGIVKSREGFQPGLIEGCSQPENGKIVSFTFKGDFTKNIEILGSDLFLAENAKFEKSETSTAKESIVIDGDFHDWNNISGVSDFEGDFVSYLYKNPDTDLLEVKVTNDDKYLYMYTRVVGVHGRTGEGGRYYWYSYIDVDQNVNTGYPPSRGDNCYFGIPIGDDSEAQFEFINNNFIKTFFGFTGIGAEKEALSGVLNLGSSYYSKTGMDGKERDRYKVEYVNQKGKRTITHDYTPGTSEDIIVALSPDGSQVEVKALLSGFLKDTNGKSLIEKGQKIDIAFGVEGSSNYYGGGEWGADSSPVIYDYLVK